MILDRGFGGFGGFLPITPCARTRRNLFSIQVDGEEPTKPTKPTRFVHQCASQLAADLAGGVQFLGSVAPPDAVVDPAGPSAHRIAAEDVIHA